MAAFVEDLRLRQKSQCKVGRNESVRFIAIIVLVALAGLIGLFVYGQMMEPELRDIEVEANHADQ
jgi:hypothetical protein